MGRGGGKNQHSKDKLYIVASEYARDWGGYKKSQDRLPFRALPFFCCGLSLLPFEDAVCTDEGVVFDIRNIVPYIKKYRRNPVNGKPLAIKDLVALHFHKNSEGQYHCPVTYKIFNDHSHIVANKKSGHVYLHEAIDMLCRKAKSWKDLITGEDFTSSDILTIQNPHEVHLREIENFDYVKRGLSPIREFAGVAAEPEAFTARIEPTEMLGRILEKTKGVEEEAKLKHDKIMTADAISSSADIVDDAEERPMHSYYTTHRAAASFTSTIVNFEPSKISTTEFRRMTDEEVREELYKVVKAKKLKGYVTIKTSLGDLNIQLHADLAPFACHNFLRHCESGFYNDTIFHRCIYNFMIQGGDPTGTGKGGMSSFSDGLPFRDEFHPKLTHTGAGVVAMANAGRNSNKSQFYFTFKSCEHLNNKHTVFGKVVGGQAVLDVMEKLATKKKTNRPKNPPVFLAAHIFKNPFDEAQKQVEEEKEKARLEKERLEKLKDTPCLSTSTSGRVGPDAMRDHPQRHSAEVGRYLPKNAISRKRPKPEEQPREVGS